MQPIFLTNSLTRQKEQFISLKPGQATVYSCGPTVYDRVHIGNLRAFIVSDILRRTLELNGYAVKQVINITDVGHLVSDADEGEDKMEKGARARGKDAWQVAKEYTELYLADSAALNLLEPAVRPRATEHIAEQIAMIERLEANGHTYRISDGIYFDVATWPAYGQLSRQKLTDKAGGVRVEIGEKRQAADFALWKFSPEESSNKRDMEWPSPWGVGFPGWHIECSAMSEKYLGVPFDIHTGGVDHIAVHHENELAQTGGALSKLQANYWLHNEFLMVDGGKMGKSLGNAFTLADITAKGFSPLAFRYFVLGASYRVPQNFTWTALEAAANALNNLLGELRSFTEPTTVNEEAKERFLACINDDLDTAQALAVLWGVVNDSSLDLGERAATVLYFDQVLGLGLAGGLIHEPVSIPQAVTALIKEREVARKNKDWALADKLRAEIAEQGFVVEDKADGQHVRQM